jgi:hypothetical protein
MLRLLILLRRLLVLLELPGRRASRRLVLLIRRRTDRSLVLRHTTGSLLELLLMELERVLELGRSAGAACRGETSVIGGLWACQLRNNQSVGLTHFACETHCEWLLLWMVR